MKNLNLKGILPEQTDLPLLADLIGATAHLLGRTTDKVEFNNLVNQLQKHKDAWQEQSAIWARMAAHNAWNQFSEQEYTENTKRAKQYLDKRIAWFESENDRELSRMQINSSKRHLGIEREKTIEEQIRDGIAAGVAAALPGAMEAERAKQEKLEALQKEQEEIESEEAALSTDAQIEIDKQTQRKERLRQIQEEMNGL